jgi:hypothetical protein
MDLHVIYAYFILPSRSLRDRPILQQFYCFQLEFHIRIGYFYTVLILRKLLKSDLNFKVNVVDLMCVKVKFLYSRSYSPPINTLLYLSTAL